MRTFLAVFICFVFSLPAAGLFAQAYPNEGFARKNAIHLEIGGHGLAYSLNYERMLLNGERFKTSIQAGFAWYPRFTGIRQTWIPVMAQQTFTLPRNSHPLEVGLGLTFTYDALVLDNMALLIPQWNYLGSARLGYRFQPPQSRWAFRAGFTPQFEFNNPLEVYPLPAISIGRTF